MNLKLTSRLLCALVLGIAATPLVHAQDQANTPAPAEGKRGKGPRGGKGAEGRGPAMMNPEARVEMLDRQLKLTADQKAKLTDIFTKARDEMRDDVQGARGGGDRTANREKMQATREKMQQAMQATRDQVATVLTDEQKKKFEQMPGMGEGGPRGGGKGPGRGPGGGKRKQGDAN